MKTFMLWLQLCQILGQEEWNKNEACVSCLFLHQFFFNLLWDRMELYPSCCDDFSSIIPKKVILPKYSRAPLVRPGVYLDFQLFPLTSCYLISVSFLQLFTCYLLKCFQLQVTDWRYLSVHVYWPVVGSSEAELAPGTLHPEAHWCLWCLPQAGLTFRPCNSWR